MTSSPALLHTADIADGGTCPDGFTGALRAAEPTGHLETIHDVPTYISRGAAPSNSTIVFLTDGFGLNLVNSKLLADHYASRSGLRVLVPNLLPGGGLPLRIMRLSDILRAHVPWYHLVGHARRARAGAQLLAILLPFGLGMRRSYPALLGYVRAVRASLPLGAKLGLAGFCLGGHWSSRICAEPTAAERDDRLVDAHFAAQPSSIGAEELAALAGRFRVPFSLALGDRDLIMSVDQARRTEAALRDVFRDEPHKLQVVLYENCGHGFAQRADPKQASENEAAERAADQAIAWFRRFLV